MQERDDAQEVADEREEQVEALQREVEELRRALEARIDALGESSSFDWRKGREMLSCFLCSP